MFHQWSVTGCKESSEWITRVKWSLSDIAFIDPAIAVSAIIRNCYCENCRFFFVFPRRVQNIALSFRSLTVLPPARPVIIPKCQLPNFFCILRLYVVNHQFWFFESSSSTAPMQVRNPAALHYSSTTLPEPVAASFKARLNLSRLSTFSENLERSFDNYGM